MSACTLKDWDCPSLTAMFNMLIGETNAILSEALRHASYTTVRGSTLVYHFGADSAQWYALASARFNRQYMDAKIRMIVPEAYVWCEMLDKPDGVPREAGEFRDLADTPDDTGIPEARP